MTPELTEWKPDVEFADNKLTEYWKRGPGAAKIKWQVPGAWTRCHRHLIKYLGDERAKRACAQWHHDVTGRWPAEDKPGQG